ncbi:hypothetical protein LEP48_03450 [Isoptericola sp. NEAU-Y5]|uniref:ABC3 transporter permease C-terminal domain-containing protein n=1 Tax=Isoptericola luteus TaxID=2879484 RepID=A0ABS7ZBX5_9MICO|nr:FtsX-like permease family protein [Isoptericola sp. NEAU-Y5]MCA5892408.1 hypothetical protein [Isoptericola sp. NEAU-Y5]
MSRGVLLARRARGHRGLLALVAVLVAVASFAACTAVGSLRASAAEVLREGFVQAGDDAALVLMSRSAPDAAGDAAQDAALRRVVAAELAGLPYRVAEDMTTLPDVGEPLRRWTVTVDLEQLDAGHLTGLAEGVASLPRLLAADDVASGRGLRVDGGLAATAAAAATTVRAAAATTLVPLTLLALVGVVALAQVARLLEAARETEVGLAVSRGASPRQVTLASGLEALVLCGGASALGAVAAGAAVGVLRAGPPAAGAPGGAQVVAGVVVAGATVGVLAAATMTLVAGIQARGAAARRVVDRSGRRRQATRAGTVVLTVAAALVTLYLLRRHGSPLVPTPTGGQVDPAAAAAPALVLAAVALLTTLVLGPAARAWERVAARRPGLVGALAARQVSRRVSVAVVPVVLLTLAGGTVVVTAAFSATARHLGERTSVLAVGADARVAFPDGVMPGPVGAFAALGGAAAAAPALVSTATVASDELTLVALPAGRLDDVLTTSDGGPDAAALAAALGGADPFRDALPLPGGTRTLDLRLTGRLSVASPDAPTVPVDPATLTQGSPRAEAQMDKFASSAVGVALWFADGDGRLTRVAAGELDHDPYGTGEGAHPVGPEPSTQELSLELPPALADASEPGGLVGLEVVTVGATDWLVSLDVSLDAATAVTDQGDRVPLELGASRWSPATGRGGGGGVLVDPGNGPALSRLHPTGTTPQPYRTVLSHRPPAVPAVVSAPLADLLDIGPGGQVELHVGGTAVRVTVADVVEVVPGALEPFAVLVDLETLNARVLDVASRPPPVNEVWVAASPGGAVDSLGRAAADVAGAAAGAQDRPPTVATVTGGRYGGILDVVPAPTGSRLADAAVPVDEAFRLTALGAVLLAVVGLAAVVVTGLGARRGEVVALRATGVPPRAQGRGRAVELLVVGLVATGVGIAGGALVSALTVSGLAQGTVTGYAVVPGAQLHVSPAIAGTGLLALVAGVVAVAVVVRTRVVAQARDTEYREEVR